jgi:hypothetical protein
MYAVIVVDTIIKTTFDQEQPNKCFNWKFFIKF